MAVIKTHDDWRANAFRDCTCGHGSYDHDSDGCTYVVQNRYPRRSILCTCHKFSPERVDSLDGQPIELGAMVRYQLPGIRYDEQIYTGEVFAVFRISTHWDIGILCADGTSTDLIWHTCVLATIKNPRM